MTEEDPIQSKGKEEDKSEEKEAFFESILLERKKDELRKVIERIVLESPRVDSALPHWIGLNSK